MLAEGCGFHRFLDLWLFAFCHLCMCEAGEISVGDWERL